jgi:hypothetical protein
MAPMTLALTALISTAPAAHPANSRTTPLSPDD